MSIIGTVRGTQEAVRITTKQGTEVAKRAAAMTRRLVGEVINAADCLLTTPAASEGERANLGQAKPPRRASSQPRSS